METLCPCLTSLKGSPVQLHDAKVPALPFRVYGPMYRSQFPHGLFYRRTRNIDDVVAGMAQPWGSFVYGHDGGDSWLQVGTLFLPRFTDGNQVLIPWTNGISNDVQDNVHGTAGRSAPTGDGSWCRIFAGHWVSSVGECHHITDGQVSFSGGSMIARMHPGEKPESFYIECGTHEAWERIDDGRDQSQGARLCALLSGADSRLHWADGDVWKRVRCVLGDRVTVV